jgi:hypothetical protein
MIEQKSYSLIRPTIDTPYHIDFEWWKTHDNNWRVFLINCLCVEHQASFREQTETTMIDWVDPVSAEIHEVDGIQTVLMEHCVKEPGFLTANTALVDAIFRVFLSNDNHPLNCLELSDRIGKPPELILRTLSGGQVFKGIRPCK